MLIEQGAQEVPFIEEVQMKLTERIAVVHWAATGPAGPEAPRKLARANSAHSSPVEMELA